MDLIIDLFDRVDPPGPAVTLIPTPTARLLAGSVPRARMVHHVSNDTYLAPAGALGRTNLLIRTLNHCYDRHLPFSFAPEVAWYAISSAVAETVRQAPEAHAHLFTTTPGAKPLIEVRDDAFVYGRPNDWTGVIPEIGAELRRRVPDGIMDHLLPRFSTSTPVTDLALLISFMDAASPYYRYVVWTLCGIPSIRLEGTAADWRLVASKAQALSEVVPALHAWFDALLPVLGTLAATAGGAPPDAPFWSDMYKLRDQSGGPRVSGWITAFFAYSVGHDGQARLRGDFDWKGWRTEGGVHRGHPGMTAEQFPLHIAGVGFTWNYLQWSIPMQFVSGITDVVQDGEFLAPRLGFGVVEQES